MTRPALLFVCLGNICRSPLAQGAMEAEAADAGLELAIDSAGTGDWHVGNPPDRRAIATARRHGIDIAGQRARQVRVEDFYRFTHIFALDMQNLRDLERMAPADGTARLRLLMDCVSGREGEPVADPYFGEDDGFDTTWQDVAAATGAIAARLAR